jgi:hypothetical protein
MDFLGDLGLAQEEPEPIPEGEALIITDAGEEFTVPVEDVPHYVIETPGGDVIYDSEDHNDEDSLFEGADIISVYTREQAIEDGLLVDVSELAAEAGFVWPVAITLALHHEIKNIPPSQSHQDYTGRLWDVLWMAHFKISRMTKQEERDGQCLYRLIMHHLAPDRSGRNRMFQYITLKIVQSYEGPDGGPCLTIMLPDED